MCALIASLSDAELELLLDPNIDKMIQYFSQITRDLCGKLNKLQLSPEVFHTLGESCLNCVRDAVLVKVQAAVSDHVGKTKLALCVNEAAFAWCVAAEARDEARDLATRVRQQVFETVLARPCSAVLSKLVELVNSVSVCAHLICLNCCMFFGAVFDQFRGHLMLYIDVVANKAFECTAEEKTDHACSITAQRVRW